MEDRVRTGSVTTALMTAALLACAHSADEGDAFPLTASMDARVQGDSVQLTLNVTNVSTRAVPLEFTSAQQYDFQVRREDGTTVWTWSAARSFAQVLTADTVAAGGSRRYTATWEPGDLTGPFVAEGRLLATEHPVVLAIPLPLDEPER